MRESSRAERFGIVSAVAPSFVFDAETDSTDHTAFELNLPDVGIRRGSHKITDGLATGSQRTTFALVCYWQDDLQSSNRRILHMEIRDQGGSRLAFAQSDVVQHLTRHPRIQFFDTKNQVPAAL